MGHTGLCVSYICLTVSEIMFALDFTHPVIDSEAIQFWSNEQDQESRALGECALRQSLVFRYVAFPELSAY